MDQYDREKDQDGTGALALRIELRNKIGDSDSGYLRQKLWGKLSEEPVKLKPGQEMRKFTDDILDIAFDSKQGKYPWMKEAPVLDSKGKPVKDENGNPKLKTVEDLKAKESAVEARANLEFKLRQWQEANPKATTDEIKKRVFDMVPEQKKLDFFRLRQERSAPKSASASADESTVAFVKDLEGFQAKAYGDYKQSSVGYGTRAKSAGETLTQSEADARLREELSMHARRVDEAAKSSGRKLTEKQRSALISFDFNTGEAVNLLSTSDDMDEVKRRLLLYTKAGGEHLPGLIARRKKEAALL